MAANIGWSSGWATPSRLVNPEIALKLAIEALRKTHGIFIVERAHCSLRIVCERVLGADMCKGNMGLKTTNRGATSLARTNATHVFENATATTATSRDAIKTRIAEINDIDVRFYAEANGELDRRIALQPPGWDGCADDCCA
eukprot:CAMPEP_0185755684 /NCGR_PEP_ID=MMETSP1174-20130828/14150_1 /TAXON_ID=35687 /ORGANISM="Dictyocha speculum, Strain CCMP1381" /LENGTH=141 /DNA_ID=CAMNT_0028434323 /DNA_START=9 /DNA_END=434 /DNA_ORIENTATION=+